MLLRTKKPTVEGVEVGDRVVEIGGVRLEGAGRSAVFEAMKGRAGERKIVVVERAGMRLPIEVKAAGF